MIGEIEDIVGGRISTHTLKQAYAAAANIACIENGFETLGIKDFNKEPTHLGYRAIHVLLKSEDSKMLEVQIRTKRQEIFAGAIHDAIYKQKLDNNKPIRRYLASLSSWLYKMDLNEKSTFPDPSKELQEKFKALGILEDILLMKPKSVLE